MSIEQRISHAPVGQNPKMPILSSNSTLTGSPVIPLRPETPKSDPSKLFNKNVTNYPQ